jgi:hypothetical protein
VTQLNINVTGTERERFDSYAAEFGLDRTGLANLLLYRELRVGRLSLKEATREPRGEKRNAKITAHLPEGRWEQFVVRAEAAKMSHSSAGAFVLLAELEERWLEKSVDK